LIKNNNNSNLWFQGGIVPDPRRQVRPDPDQGGNEERIPGFQWKDHKKVVIISIYWTGKGEKVYAKRWKYLGSNLISQI
jgi:hypothetical protein